MKKITVISLVVIMLALSTVPAFAKGKQPATRGTGISVCTGTGTSIDAGTQKGFGVRSPYALSGSISAIDTETRTITVTIVCGNRLVQPFIGQEVTLQTTDTTGFLLRNSDGSVTPITFNDLAIGQNVSSHGTLVDEIWTATRVTSGALLNCQSLSNHPYFT